MDIHQKGEAGESTRDTSVPVETETKEETIAPVPDVVRAIEEKPSAEASSSVFETMANLILASLMFLVPVFFIPSLALPFQFAKGILFVIAVVVIFVLWTFSRLKQGSLSIPQTYIIPGMLLIPATFLAATIFSNSVTGSLIGQGGEIGTFASMAFLSLLFFVTSMACDSRDRIVRIYLALFAAFAVLSLFELARMFIGPQFLAFGIFTTTIGNVFGKWNDLGVFYGLVIVMTLVALQMLALKKVARAILYGILLIALFFLVLVDFVTVWFVLGLFAIILGIYALSVSRMVKSRLQAEEGKELGRKKLFLQRIPVASIIVFAFCLAFIMANAPLGDFFAQKFNITHIEARPSWQSTFGIVKSTLPKNVFFGAGPNRFNTQWQLYRPDGINETLFWSTNFNSGIGHVPTFFATTGIVGAAAWILFFGLFIASGLRSLFVSRGDRFIHFLVLSSFLASLYLWIFMVLYNPSIPLVIMAFLFTGLYVATLVQEKIIRRGYISFAVNPKLGFLCSLTLIIAVCAATGGAYFMTRSFIATIDYQKASDALDKNDTAVGKQYLQKALTWHAFDGYYRLLASINLAELNVLLSKQGISREELKAQWDRLFGEAKQNVEHARDLDPAQYQNWVAIGNLYGAIMSVDPGKVYPIARDAYDHARALSPRDPSLALALARLDAAKGDLNAARADIAEAVRLKNNYTEAIFFLSQIEVSAGNLGKAIESVETAARFAPDDPTVFFQLGLLKYNNNDNKGATEALEHAVSLNDAYSNARYFLGLAYERLDRIPDAIKQFEEIEKHNPDNAEVKSILSNLRAGQKPFAEKKTSERPEDRAKLPIEEKSDQPVLLPAKPISVDSKSVSQ